MPSTVGDLFRSSSLDEYIGQERLKKQILTHITAAAMEFRPPEHMLLTGPPGYGKTTLAGLLADKAGLPFKSMVMPVEFTVIVRELVFNGYQGILFLDEIHRLSPRQQEDYLTVVEERIVQWKGNKYMCPGITIIAATTERRKILKPLLDRFTMHLQFAPYSNEEMAKIQAIMLRKVGVALPGDDVMALAKACLSTPRRARDFAVGARDLKALGLPYRAENLFKHLSIDPDGLTEAHFEYLRTIQLLGGEAGLRPIATYLGENEAIVEELERLLVKRGLLTYGSRGRCMTAEGHQKLRQHAA